MIENQSEQFLEESKPKPNNDKNEKPTMKKHL